MKDAKKFMNAFIWIMAIFVIANMLSNTEKTDSNQQSYSDFISSVKSGIIRSVEISGGNIKSENINGETMTTYNPGDLGLMGDLLDSGVEIITKPPEKESLLTSILMSLLPIFFIIGAIVWMSKSQGGGSGGVFGVGKSKAKMIEAEHTTKTLDDVAGIEEAKDDVTEIIDFLSNPGKYTRVGGKIPRGVLLTGPPGTGKTLLAKAVAGEAKVPFFFTSGSDFVEMFVGVGASRVRDMFEQAKKVAPSIIFIDEIDAIGKQRGSGGAQGGNDEREQTLNQLLVEMDGFEGSEGVIVIAATNRPDVLDRALLRPGRFDRQIIVGLPDVAGREQILKTHAKKVKLKDGVKLKDIARGTPGFSGADLANLINEAALMTASNDKDFITKNELELAKDKIMMGAERKSMIMPETEREMTAYHEAGHAIVGRLVPDHDPVYKVSIVPRGRALGVTMFLPKQDSYSVSKEKLEGQISSLFGGRIAEEIIYGEQGVSTGASNDIERATKIARDMVEKWGMSELGPISFEKVLGEDGVLRNVFSAKTQEKVDVQINKVIKKAFDEAERILRENTDILESMTRLLIELETIDEDQIDMLMKREVLKEE